MEKLSEGPVSVSKLTEPFDVTLAAVVQHLQDRLGELMASRADADGKNKRHAGGTRHRQSPGIRRDMAIQSLEDAKDSLLAQIA
jgi:hypothetical protein